MDVHASRLLRRDIRIIAVDRLSGMSYKILAVKGPAAARRAVEKARTT